MLDAEHRRREQSCAEIRAENARLLAGFQQWLSHSGLAAKTVRQHVENVGFYINSYLLSEDAVPAAKGADRISMFLSYWFIRKATWASPSSIRQNATSLKKFYTFLQQQGKTAADDVRELNETIKEEMPDWLRTMQRYDDPDVTDPGDIWGF